MDACILTNRKEAVKIMLLMNACVTFLDFKGTSMVKMDPFMKPNINASLYRVDPESKSHVD